MENSYSVYYCAHCERKFQDSIKFQLETFSLFFQPQSEIVLKSFLIFGQSEPHCSYKVVLKKSVYITIKRYNCQLNTVHNTVHLKTQSVRLILIS